MEINYIFSSLYISYTITCKCSMSLLYRTTELPKIVYSIVRNLKEQCYSNSNTYFIYL